MHHCHFFQCISSKTRPNLLVTLVVFVFSRVLVVFPEREAALELPALL